MYMDKGFEMANDQIAKATAGGKKVSSMIIAFTDGTLEPAVFANTKVEARKARHMGATVYAVGVKDFLQSQLEGFADTKEHAFGVLGGFKALQSITDKLGEKSCIELKSLDPVVACVGGEYRVVVRGSGFQNTRDKSSVICRFKFTDNSILDETAITVEEKFITCPGVELKEPGEPIFVEISLNKGITFIANNLKFRGKDCGENPAAKPTEDKAGNPSKVNSQRLIEQTPEKAPEMPLEVAPKNLPGKAPEQAPGKPPQKPPAKLFKRLAARALKWLSKYRFPSSDVDSRDKRTEQEGNPEGGGEEAEPRGLEIPLPPVVKSFISTGSSSSDFPWIPVVVGAAALLFLLLLCCFFYLWCWCKKKPPDPCRTVCCCLPWPMVMPACCDCLDTGCLSQMEVEKAFTPMRAWRVPVISDPRLRLSPNCESVPFPVCPGCCHSPGAYSQSSWMLPLVSPCSQAQAACPP
ncbi:anthrax toxin receptor-like [Dasypus novemcinctus]|uniref:anthrax toxin receptor-like n=1 Tax=Dasypus novemcinctus TaxID=9361 RepID=UPI00265FB9A0|nr:anthrax toxin receptor-like isoform X2 [Dasypus novemcinctus]